MSCPFCPPAEDQVFLDGSGVWLVWSKFAVAEGHALIIPKRHVERFLDLTFPERELIHSYMLDAYEAIDNDPRWPRPDGYNVGFNDGPAAGQTVPHFHVHVIPRRTGDVPDPRGGIRNVLPGGNYLAGPKP